MAIPVAVGDNVRVIMKGLWNSEVVTNNVFYFTVNDITTTIAGDATLQNLARGFWNEVQAALLILSSHRQNYLELVAESLDADANLINGESYFVATGTGVGGDPNDSLPPADAWTFRYVRPDASKRHGYKRFPGVPEADNVDGMPSTGSVSSLDALATALTGPFHFWTNIAGTDTADGGLFVPALVQKRLNGDVVSPAVFYHPSSVVFQKIGHQDTRDIGRGV